MLQRLLYKFQLSRFGVPRSKQVRAEEEKVGLSHLDIDWSYCAQNVFLRAHESP